MNTQTHIIMGAALFGGKMPKRAWAGALGGFTPDIPMLLIVGALKLYGIPNILIFGFLYWQNWWQIANAIAHNFWLWGAIILISVVLRERRNLSPLEIDRWTLPIIFASSALLHTTIDFLCHREDAHMSFWPVSNWKFISPVSYYDAQHFGQYFTIFEALIGVGFALLLMARYASRTLRAVLLVALLFYVVVPAYFILN